MGNSRVSAFTVVPLGLYVYVLKRSSAAQGYPIVCVDILSLYIPVSKLNQDSHGYPLEVVSRVFDPKSQESILICLSNEGRHYRQVLVFTFRSVMVILVVTAAADVILVVEGRHYRQW